MTGVTHPKRPAPLSIRLSDKERRTLERLAGDVPLSRFIKQQIFAETPKAAKSEVTDQYEMFVRVLAALGESEVFANLDVIAKAVDRGELHLSDEQVNQIGAACILVMELRNDIMRGLGIKPPPLPDDVGCL